MSLKKFKCRTVLFICFLICSINLSAQEAFQISGLVSTELNEPIVGAQVFLDGTTIGVLTDEHGSFTLTDIPEGIYEIFVRSLGYNSANTSINTNNLAPIYNFVLSEKIYELDEITVKPDPENRAINLQEFKKVFVGLGPFSNQTKILNEDDLTFHFDIENSVLEAFSNKRIEIENKALGYKIFFYMDEFSINYKQGTTYFYGQTLFQELTSRRKRTRNKWKKNRKSAYQSSFTYFIHSLINDDVLTNGFIVKGEKRDKNATYLAKDTVSSQQFFTLVDSTTYKMSFINFLNVTNTQQYEDMSYLHYIAKPFDSNPRKLVNFQNSSVTMITDSVLIDKSGYIINPKGLLFDGYWAFQKISDMLPIEFRPSN